MVRILKTQEKLWKRPKCRCWQLKTFISAFSKLPFKRTLVCLLILKLNQSQNTKKSFFWVFLQKPKMCILRIKKLFWKLKFPKKDRLHVLIFYYICVWPTKVVNTIFLLQIRFLRYRLAGTQSPSATQPKIRLCPQISLGSKTEAKHSETIFREIAKLTPQFRFEAKQEF